MRLSIVIVSWNVCKDLIQCLDSIRKYRPFGKYEVIVVDNASTDETVDIVRIRFPEVMMIVNSDNKGFAAANNQGIEKSQSEYILLLNPDTILHPGSLDLLIDFMDSNKEVRACGPKLLNADGTIQRSVRHFPTFRGALYRHTAFRFLGIFRKDYKKWLMKDFDHETRKEVDQLMGAALLIRKAVIDRIGGMDERFFMYYEEVDLCYRIQQAGWRIVFVPEALITHLGSRSSGQIPVRKRIMMLTSLLKFFRKHRGKSITAVFNCLFKPAIILRNICDIISGTFSYMFSVITINSKKRNRSAVKIKTSSVLLGKYSWQLIKI
jgi:GT2 family glycosyltransferase